MSYDSPVQRRSWNEFRDSGLLWFTNRILHVFGWSIICKIEDNNEITEIYPARVQYRGFPESVEENGFRALSQHIFENTDMFGKEGAMPHKRD